MANSPSQVAGTKAPERERPWRWLAPLWLRLGLLVAVGLGLGFPLFEFVWQRFFQQERSRVARVARSFFDAVQSADVRAPQAFLAPDAALPNPALALDWFTCMGSPFLECQVDGVMIHSRNAAAHFTCRRVDNPQPIQETALNPGVNRLATPALRAMAQRLDGRRGALLLERINNEWCVHTLSLFEDLSGVKEDAYPSPFVGKIDFRETAKNALQLPAELAARSQFLKNLAAIETNAVQTGWKTDINIVNQPAREALRALAGELGLTLVVAANPGEPAVAKSLTQPVSLKLQGRSRLEAIEEVCRQVDVHPRYSSVGSLQVKKGPCPGATTFAGPFRVTVETLAEFPASATATVSLNVVAAGLPAPVSALTLEDGRVLEITQVSGNGRDLYHRDNQSLFALRRNLPDRVPVLRGAGVSDGVGPIMPGPGILSPPPPGPGGFGEPDISGSGGAAPPRGEGGMPTGRRDPEPPRFLHKVIDVTLDVPLRHVLKDLDTIPELRGRVQVLVPTTVDTLVFPTLEPGVTQKTSQTHMTFHKAGEPTGTSLSATLLFDYQGNKDRQLWWTAVDEKESAVKTGRTVPSESVRLEVPISTTAVHFKIVGTHPEGWDFELRDLPLKQRPPQKLQPALFPEHDAPVSVDIGFDKFATRSRSAFVTLQNHSDKDVDRIDVTLSYRDEAGRELKQSRQILADYDRFEHRLRVQVGARARGFTSLADRDLPPQTKTIAVTVTRVSFVDGASWSAPQE